MIIDPVGLAVYVVMLRFFIQFNLSVRFTVLTIGIAPVVFNGAYRAIMASISHASLSSIFSPTDIVMAAIQLVLALVIVRLLERYEESLSAWFTITLIGAAVSYALVPSLMRSLTL